MATPVKFLFDNQFGLGSSETAPKDEPDGRTEENLPQEMFSSDDMRAAGEQEYARGARAGAEQVEARIEAEIVRSLEQLGSQVDALAADHCNVQQQMGRDATELALVIARKLSSTLVARAPIAEMEAMIKSCLSEQHSAPKIVARVSDQMIGPLKERVDGLTGQSGFLGDLVLIADDSLEGSACRVEWANGGAERNPRSLDAAIEAAVQSFVEASFPRSSAAGETGNPKTDEDTPGMTQHTEDTTEAHPPVRSGEN